MISTVKGVQYVRCIREFNSIRDPHENFGRLGSVYRVTHTVADEGYPVRYYALHELTVGWVNVSRFEKVTVT